MAETVTTGARRVSRRAAACGRLSVTSQVVRFYYYVICPLCETKRRGRQAAALVLGLAFAFLLEKTEAV
ncbi:MAG TPA: hypothetical protein VMR62_14760, partial [Bryobacteraceae bacterium]|nr:hypothetical protein [Bryobacteraceae bacterium]